MRMVTVSSQVNTWRRMAHGEREPLKATFERWKWAASVRESTVAVKRVS